MRWLQWAQVDQLTTPYRVLKYSAITYAFAQVFLWIGTLAAIVTGQHRAAFLFVLFNIWLIVAMAWSTYAGCKRAWTGQPYDELKESIPFLVTGAMVFALGWTIKALFY